MIRELSTGILKENRTKRNFFFFFLRSFWMTSPANNPNLFYPRHFTDSVTNRVISWVIYDRVNGKGEPTYKNFVPSFRPCYLTRKTLRSNFISSCDFSHLHKPKVSFTMKVFMCVPSKRISERSDPWTGTPQ